MRILSTNADFVREPLAAPMGFKGSYLSELWQSVVRLSSEDHTGIGVGVQSVLWSDANVFMHSSQSAGNAYMFAMTSYALKLIVGMEFHDPFSLLDTLLPEVYEYGKRITGQPNLRKTFALNSLVCIDYAAWQLYAKAQNTKDFLHLVPNELKAPLRCQQTELGNIPLITYGMDLGSIKSLAEKGHFFLKIKIGSDPDKDGSRQKMLAWDKKRLCEIHEAIKDIPTQYTNSGHILYYLDANGRYDSKDRLKELLEYADKIGALERIAILEEPFPEEYQEDVSDLPVRIAADESAHSDEDAIRRMEEGYSAIALKPIAKTMSMSLRILQEAHQRNVPCFCADLTVNPLMVEFNKNVAARIAPLPGMKIGVLESNGAQNYADWPRLTAYHPMYQTAKFISPNQGIYSLDAEFYKTSGGIFDDAAYYTALVK